MSDNTVNHDEINYEKMWLEEKVTKLQLESQLLQMQFTKVQEQLQITNMELLKFKKDEKIHEHVEMMKNAHSNPQKEPPVKEE